MIIYLYIKLSYIIAHPCPNFNSSFPGQDGYHFAGYIFRYIFMDKKFCILIKISLKFIPKGLIYKNPALV